MLGLVLRLGWGWGLRVGAPASRVGMESAWRLHGDWMEVGWRLDGGCMEIAWRLDGGCMEIAWKAVDASRPCVGTGLTSEHVGEVDGDADALRTQGLVRWTNQRTS